jgi:hypothetical protein
MPKIFFIGFPKTGSYSFYSYFSEITDRRLHNPNAVLEKIGYKKEWGEKMGGKLKFSPEVFSQKLAESIDLKKLKKIIEQNDVIADVPFMFLYPWLVENYPRSYFVYVSRDPMKWYQSMTMYFGSSLKNNDNNLFEAVFGSQVPGRSRKTYLKKYIQWNQAIIDYFRERPEIKFLLYDLSISNTEKTRLIKDFLPIEMCPSTDFPFNHYTKIKKYTYRNISFYKFNFEKKNIEKVEFINIDFRKTNLNEVYFRNCSFQQCDLRSIDFSTTTFEDCFIDDDCLFDNQKIRLNLNLKSVIEE